MTKATRCFAEAATQGHADAQLSLGRIHEQGIGVHHDPYRAAKYFRLAAEQGHVEASYQLALLYATGKGVTRNIVNAHLLASIAASRAHTKAIEFIEALESALDESERQHVRTQTERYLKALGSTP
jgi:hypothetical protein